MSFNCKLNRNISLLDAQPHAKCGSVGSMNGGIRGRIYVYNISDVSNLIFEGDNRYDETLIISTIATQNSYFYIDCTSIEYNENYENETYTHTLSFKIANSLSYTEDALSEAANSKYLVAFKVNGDENYKLFGWKDGAELSYTLSINETDNSYNVTLKDESIYPLMSCYADNFNLSSKVFEPIWQPLYEISYCKLENHWYNGYVIASYVVRVNNSGDALDEDNKLCQYSNKPQVAYKYYAVDDGNYKIVGQYDEMAVFDGKPVKIYDNELCPIYATGTIFTNISEVEFDSFNTSATINITCDDDWIIADKPLQATVSQMNGSGNTTLTIASTKRGGVGKIILENQSTFERIEIIVKGWFIRGLQDTYVIDSAISSFPIEPIIESVTSDELTLITSIPYTDEGNNRFLCQMTSMNGGAYSITFKIAEHEAEYKTILIIKKLPLSSEPIWKLVNDYCEYEIL